MVADLDALLCETYKWIRRDKIIRHPILRNRNTTMAISSMNPLTPFRRAVSSFPSGVPYLPPRETYEELSELSHQDREILVVTKQVTQWTLDEYAGSICLPRSYEFFRFRLRETSTRGRTWRGNQVVQLRYVLTTLHSSLGGT